MKILYYSENTPGTYTGFGNQGEFLVHHWITQGHEVFCVTPITDNIPTIQRVFGALGLPGNPADIVNYVNILDFNVDDKIIFLSETFILHNYYQSLEQLYPRAIGIAVIDGHPVGARDKSLWQKVATVVTLSNFAYQEIPGSTLIPHGINTDFFTPITPEERAKVRGWIEIGNDNTFIVGWIGSNVSLKGLHVAVEAVGLLNKRYPARDIRMLIKKELTSAEREWVKMCGVKTVAWNPDLLPDLRHFYNVMDVNLLPSQGEAFSITTGESQSCGVPNVVTDYSGCKELVEGHGELIPVTLWRPCGCCNLPRAFVTAEDTADCLEKLLLDKQLREDYGKRAQEAMQQYSWENVLQAWDLLLEKN